MFCCAPTHILRTGPHTPLCCGCTEWRGGCACTANTVYFNGSSEYSRAHSLSCTLNGASCTCIATSLFCAAEALRRMGSHSQDGDGSQGWGMHLSDIYGISCWDIYLMLECSKISYSYKTFMRVTAPTCAICGPHSKGP